MTIRTIYRLTSIGRPLEPGYPTNLAVLLLLPVVAALMAWLSTLALAGSGTPLSAVLAGVLTAFASWALIRELAPDDNPAAFFGMAMALVALLLFDPGTVLPLFVALFLVRIVNRSTGLAPTPLDSLLVTLLASWATFALDQPLLGLAAATAFALDAELRDGRRSQWLAAAACAAASGAALLKGGAVSALPDAGAGLLVMAVLTGLLYFGAVVMTSRLHAVGDATGTPLDTSRVRAGMLVGLLVVGQAAVASPASESGIDVLGVACLLAVGLSAVWRRALVAVAWRPASVVSQFLAYCGLVALLVAAGFASLYVPDPGPAAPSVVVSVDNSLWNRLGLNRFTYVRLLRQQGLRAVVVRFDSPGDAAPAEALLADAGGLLLTGGGDVGAVNYSGDPALTSNVKPGRDELELALMAEAERRGQPVLGLCRGMQLMNVYFGGTLGAFRGEPARYRRHMRHLAGHAVTLSPDSRLASIYAGDIDQHVTTLHGQFVADTGDNVRIVARADDGTPEAIEVGEGPEFGMLGVQWHAEVPPWDRRQRRLFEAFAMAVKNEER